METLKCRCGNSRRFTRIHTINAVAAAYGEEGKDVPPMVQCASCRNVYAFDGYGWFLDGLTEDLRRGD